jgi:hypothetical protein
MTESVGRPRIHTAVWYVHAENVDRVRTYWEQALGLSMTEIELSPERGLRILLDFDAGVEVIAATQPSEDWSNKRVRKYLAERGEGVYNVIYDVDSIDEVSELMLKEGAVLEFDHTTTAPPELVRGRGVRSQESTSFKMRLAQFLDPLGGGICLQEIRAEPGRSDGGQSS